MPTRLIDSLRRSALLLAAGLCLATPLGQAAQAGLIQPGNNANAFREARRGEDQSITFKAPADRTMIQTEGEMWRRARNGPLTLWGGWLLAGVFVAIAAFYFIRGSIKLEEKPTGRLIERFSPVERITHWTVAGCFVLLAFSGLIMLFGKHALLPWMGYTLFSWLAVIAKKDRKSTRLN